MVGRLETCLLFALSSPLEEVQQVQIPAPIKLISYNGRAFWNIVVCRIRGMRPIGVPEGLGVTYRHVAYRLYVSADTVDGPLSGLFFVHSQADNRLISWGGNVASDFRFHVANISVHADEKSVTAEGRSYSSRLDDAFALRGSCQVGPPELQSSLFGNAEESLHYLKYQPLGLAVGREGELRIAEVVRDEAAWQERHFAVEHMKWNLLKSLGQHNVRLELALCVDPIAYRWRIGRSTNLQR